MQFIDFTELDLKKRRCLCLAIRMRLPTEKCNGCKHRQCLEQYLPDFHCVVKEPGTLADYKTLLENLKFNMPIDEVHRYRLDHELNM